MWVEKEEGINEEEEGDNNPTINIPWSATPLLQQLSRGLYRAICLSGEYETVKGAIDWSKATSRGAKRRVEEGSEEGVSPFPGMGVRGVTHGKILKFETQFGAIWWIWQEIDGSPVFTARCTLVQSAKRGIAIVYCLSVRPSVTIRYRDHIGWNSSKIISRPYSLGPVWGLTPTWAIWSNENTPKIGAE